MTSADLVALVKKHPIGVVCGLVSIVCAVLLYVRWDKIAVTQGQLEASSAQAAKMISNVRNSNGMAEQVAEIQTLTKEMEARLMKASQLAVNLQYFYKLETETGLAKPVEVRQGNYPRNVKTMYAGVPFTVSIQGTFPQVMNFLNRLQNGRHFCRINTANFTKAADASGDITLALTLELLGQP